MHPPRTKTPEAPPQTAAGYAKARKPYRAPELVLYGDIRQITRALNSLMGAADGMMIGPLVLKTGGF
ncbi:MAG: hypothetical protein MI919_07560 [Holophagales bacterium]|nr:hypothetical protein [Holophagales bacterium]